MAVRSVAKQRRGGHGPVKKKVRVLLAALGVLAGAFLLGWFLRMQGVKMLDRSTLIPIMDSKTFKTGYMNAGGKMVINPVYSYAGEFENGFAVVRQEKDNQEQEGIIDKTGKTVFPFMNADLQVCADGTIIASKNTATSGAEPVVRYGCYGSDGKQILPFDYEFLSPFTNGKAFAQKGGAWCIINKTGAVIKQLSGVKLVLTGFMGNGLVPFTTKGTDFQSSFDSDHWGYLNEDGTVAIPEQFLWATGFENGRALALKLSEDGQKQTVLIDKTGKEMKNLGNYEFGDGFMDGIAVGYGDKGFGALNSNGDWVVEAKCEHVTYRDGVITADVSPNHFLFFNKRGAKLLELKYPCTAFANGYIFYTKDGKTYMMDVYGRTVCTVPGGFEPTE